MPSIFLADDDAEHAFLAARAFREAGVAEPLVTAASGDEAVAALSAARPLPALVLLDQDLPGRPGLEVLQWIRTQQRLCTLPVLILSGSTNPSDARAAYLLGANGFVVKPSGYDEMLRLARAIRDYWLDFNRGA